MEVAVKLSGIDKGYCMNTFRDLLSLLKSANCSHDSVSAFWRDADDANLKQTANSMRLEAAILVYYFVHEWDIVQLKRPDVFEGLIF